MTIEPIGTVTKIAGGDADSITRSIDYGERVICLVELTTTEVGLKPGSGGPMEHRSLKPVAVFELEGDLGVRTLNALKERARAAAQAGAGAIPGIAEHFDDAAARAGRELVEVDGAIVEPEVAAAVASGDDVPAAHDPSLDEAQVPPFDGYDLATVAVIGEWLDERTGDEGRARARWVIAYETKHKARKTLLDRCFGMVEPLGDAPDLPVDGEGFGPSDDDLDLGDEEPDLADEPGAPADAEDLEVDDDELEL